MYFSVPRFNGDYALVSIDSKDSTFAIVFGVVGGLVALVVIIIVIIYFVKRSKRSSYVPPTQNNTYIPPAQMYSPNVNAYSNNLVAKAPPMDNHTSPVVHLTTLDAPVTYEQNSGSNYPPTYPPQNHY